MQSLNNNNNEGDPWAPAAWEALRSTQARGRGGGRKAGPPSLTPHCCNPLQKLSRRFSCFSQHSNGTPSTMMLNLKNKGNKDGWDISYTPTILVFSVVEVRGWTNSRKLACQINRCVRIVGLSFIVSTRNCFRHSKWMLPGPACLQMRRTWGRSGV